ncbi:major capsid protein [Leucobacter sp. Z1108]|uniref:major capsid protein n=1 Tax=Leucobacter sp. Z1108 TaxID=3439066 RepID=UPI003F377BBE
MAFTKDHRTPVQLTGIAQAAFDAVYGASIAAAYLPIKEERTLTYDFNVGSSLLPRAARFRSFNTESDVSSIGAGESRQGKLPPISRRLHVDEYAQLQLTGGDIGDKFEEYARLIAVEIATRMVLAAAEGIETGKVTIAERGLAFEVNFGRKAGLTANAVANWSSASASAITDLEALRAVYGSEPGALVVPSAVMTHLTTNTEIIKFVVQRGSDLPSRVSHADVLSVLGSFGFGNVVSNNERLIDQNGTERALFDPKKVLFLPSGAATAIATATGTGPLGNTVIGVTAESLSTENGIGGAAGLFSGALAQHDPEGYDVLVSGLGLPVVQNPDATASLKVLA